MTSIPIIFLYNDKYYKANVKKIAGAPVEYYLFNIDPPLIPINAPIVLVSDPTANSLVYDSNNLNHAVAAAIIEACRVLDEPLHV